MKNLTAIDKKILSFLNLDLADKILNESTIMDFPKETEILKEQQHVKVLLIAISGLFKVFFRLDKRELLFYYIELEQSFIITFYTSLKNASSKVFAITEEDSKIILTPVRFLAQWLKKHPDFSELFYNQFNLTYLELVDTMRHLLLDRQIIKNLCETLKKHT